MIQHTLGSISPKINTIGKMTIIDNYHHYELQLDVIA